MGLPCAGLATGLLLCAAVGWAPEIRWQAPLEIARGAGKRGAWQQNDAGGVLHLVHAESRGGPFEPGGTLNQ